MSTVRRSQRALLAALFMTLPFSQSVGQALTPGTRVRVRSPQVVAPVIGSYQGMRRDTVVVIEDGTAAHVWSFTSANIDRLEVSAGMKGGNRGPMTRWALIGGGAGAVAGFLVAAILEGSELIPVQRRAERGRWCRRRRGRWSRIRVSRARGALDVGCRPAACGARPSTCRFPPGVLGVVLVRTRTGSKGID